MAGNKPSHVVVIYDRNDYATRVGVAWPLKNRTGFTLTLHAGVSISSMDGARIVVLPDEPRDKDGEQRGERREERGRR